MAAGGKRIRTGVALSLTELCATDIRLGADAERGWRVPLEPMDPSVAGWGSLAARLRELAQRVGGEGGPLVIALMPPLTEVRSLELPPLKRDQVLQLLSRNAHRYFVGAREPQVVGASVPRRGRNTNGPVLGVAAPARLVTAISAAARDAGWVLEGIVPAEVGWSVAARSMFPGATKGPASVLVAQPDRTDLLRIENGDLVSVRRFRPGSLDADVIASVIDETRSNGTAPRTLAVGAAAPRQELIRALGPQRPVTTATADWSAAAADPMLTAATWANPEDGLTLRTEEVAELRAAEGRKFVALAVAAAIALLLAAAAFRLVDVKRELASVKAQRAQIRPQLQSMLAGRTNLENSTRKLNALFAAHREAPQLSGVMASVTDALPQGAYLLSFRARRDTLILDGLATNSGEAFAGIESVPELVNVRSVAGIQRQLQDDGSALEHFTIQGRMLLPVPPAPSPITRRRP